MKIKRLCAANIREAMRMVREDLGPDAVILSNRRVSSGIEIVAAIDYDEALVGEELAGEADPAPTPAGGAPPPAAPPAPVPDRVGAAEPAKAWGRSPAAPSADAPAPAPAPAPGKRTAAPQRGEEGGKPRVVWSQDPMLVDMQGELRAVRELLEQQLSGLAWGELGRRQPARAELLRRLMDYGLARDHCLGLAEAARGENDPERAWERVLSRLVETVVVGQDEILTQGGVVALVGPTGVGKTTTVAKLAARYTLRHGPRRVALVTTDSFRIGAYDQLRTFGMILDTPVRLASTAAELRSVIAEFSDRSLILIDTAGMSQRDMRLSQQFDLITDASGVHSYLVVAANAQPSTLEETAGAFARMRLAGCILTKLDEATRLGGALSMAHNHRLPVAYLSNGQRVPEDLQTARADDLIRFGAELIRAPGAAPDDEALALTLGRRVVNAYL